MNPFTALRRLTYRTALSTPDQSTGLIVANRGWGRRTVHHPGVPVYLEARRIRLLRHGFDRIDMALMDPQLLALLYVTAARINAGQPHPRRDNSPTRSDVRSDVRSDARPSPRRRPSPLRKPDGRMPEGRVLEGQLR